MDFEKYGKYLELGSKDEDDAMRLIENKIGGKCIKTTKELDINSHTDFIWISPNNTVCSIDKKMIKKVSRSSKNASNEMTWIELVGNSGLPGSATPQTDNLTRYGFEINPPNDYLMIETYNDFLFLQREKLSKFVKDKIEGKELVYKNPQKPYIPYQRKSYGHKDVNVLVPNKELYQLAQFIIKKN